MTTLENRIMQACKWESPELAGTLLYHGDSMPGEVNIDIVCIRNSDTISLTWVSFDANKKTNQRQLVVDRKTDQVSANLSDAEFISHDNIEQFLNMVAKSIVYDTPTFLPEQPLAEIHPEAQRKNRMI